MASTTLKIRTKRPVRSNHHTSCNLILEVAACLENGHIVSGASNKKVWVFSRVKKRKAAAEIIQALENSVKGSSIPKQQLITPNLGHWVQQNNRIAPKKAAASNISVSADSKASDTTGKTLAGIPGRDKIRFVTGATLMEQGDEYSPKWNLGLEHRTSNDRQEPWRTSCIQRTSPDLGQPESNGLGSSLEAAK
ncbi:MAG: hypothetical protein L6R38_001822 [Xanthoria sp. 2 TBL-2021]|nr:MAG: hypothetical protein L6R38_001822 [Xanthoria sp. 2 TBL-2021]